jgi:hypothetical protein
MESADHLCQRPLKKKKKKKKSKKPLSGLFLPLQYFHCFSFFIGYNSKSFGFYMYIWRGKNRRDKRNLLLSGETFWGAEKGAKNFEHEDNVLRLEREADHIRYYSNKIKALMTQYLDTEKGHKEVDLLVLEREKFIDPNETLIKQTEEENELVRANLFDIFVKFCLPETTYISKEGLKDLFSDLQLTMSERSFNKYVKKLNLERKDAAVDFDSFFNGKKWTVHKKI